MTKQLSLDTYKFKREDCIHLPEHLSEEELVNQALFLGRFGSRLVRILITKTKSRMTFTGHDATDKEYEKALVFGSANQTGPYSYSIQWRDPFSDLRFEAILAL
tara:strand:- start:275 stop:586 length:312 start_codon:yes stop_codon:yes gene_type:complete